MTVQICLIILSRNKNIGVNFLFFFWHHTEAVSSYYWDQQQVLKKNFLHLGQEGRDRPCHHFKTEQIK